MIKLPFNVLIEEMDLGYKDSIENKILMRIKRDLPDLFTSRLAPTIYTGNALGRLDRITECFQKNP